MLTACATAFTGVHGSDHLAYNRKRAHWLARWCLKRATVPTLLLQFSNLTKVPYDAVVMQVANVFFPAVPESGVQEVIVATEEIS